MKYIIYHLKEFIQEENATKFTFLSFIYFYEYVNVT